MYVLCVRVVLFSGADGYDGGLPQESGDKTTFWVDGKEMQWDFGIIRRIRIFCPLSAQI